MAVQDPSAQVWGVGPVHYCRYGKAVVIGRSLEQAGAGVERVEVPATRNEILRGRKLSRLGLVDCENEVVDVFVGGFGTV